MICRRMQELILYQRCVPTSPPDMSFQKYYLVSDEHCIRRYGKTLHNYKVRHVYGTSVDARWEFVTRPRWVVHSAQRWLQFAALSFLRIIPSVIILLDDNLFKMFVSKFKIIRDIKNSLLQSNRFNLIFFVLRKLKKIVHVSKYDFISPPNECLTNRDKCKIFTTTHSPCVKTKGFMQRIRHRR